MNVENNFHQQMKTMGIQSYFQWALIKHIVLIIHTSLNMESRTEYGELFLSTILFIAA